MDDGRIRNKKVVFSVYHFHRIRVDDSRSRNKKVVFSVIVFIVYVWTMAVSVTKKLCFRSSFSSYTCGRWPYP